MGDVGDLPNRVPQAAFDCLLRAKLRIRPALHYQITFDQPAVRPLGPQPVACGFVHRRQEAVFLFLQVVQIAPADTDEALSDTFQRLMPVRIFLILLRHQLPDIVLIISQIYHGSLLLVFGVTQITLERPIRQGSPTKKARFRAFFFLRIIPALHRGSGQEAAPKYRQCRWPLPP